ncbi:hypothetical protein SmJEL517_g00344 [Synchytrium microbalum]|uniref:RRM domain-containing protein n=1 Tax=Synchytrium microbalum TaxID=1806994 RepID=A0A507CBC1_9FUNG|nr:uncharacterized protein SmJEL517_g00344 [Synchytrium microbalum]TPX38357.1 hypothetical protein SmJEL517_g00344 [Synchytrium microbalum]
MTHSPSPSSTKRHTDRDKPQPSVSTSTQTDPTTIVSSVESPIPTEQQRPQIPARSLSPSHSRMFDRLPHPLVRSSSSTVVLHTPPASSSSGRSTPTAILELTKAVDGLHIETRVPGRSYSAPASPVEKVGMDDEAGAGGAKTGEESRTGYATDNEGSVVEENQGRNENVGAAANEAAESNSQHVRTPEVPPAPSEEEVLEPEHPKGLPAACLFVASLSSSRTDEQLQESVSKHFEQWGTLLHVKVLKDVMSRPYSFVQFENPDDAKRALAAAHSTTVDGRRIRVEQARVNRTLFIARFARHAADTSVQSHERFLMDCLTRFGPVEDLTVVNDDFGRSRNCAYVKFAFRDDAIRAFIGVRRNHRWICEWCESNLNMSISTEYPERADTGRNGQYVDYNSIFVGNLTPKVTYQLLEQRFGEYGSITGMRLHDAVKNGATNTKPAHAFVTYKEEESAYRAVEDTNGQTWIDRPLKVQLKESPGNRPQPYMNQQHLQTSAQAAPLAPLPPHMMPPIYMNQQYQNYPPPPPPFPQGNAVMEGGGFVPVTPPMSPVHMRVLSGDSGPLWMPTYDYEGMPMGEPESPMMVSNMIPTMMNIIPPGAPSPSSQGMMPAPPSFTPQMPVTPVQPQMMPQTPLPPFFIQGGCDALPSPSQPFQTPQFPYMLQYPPGLPYHGGPNPTNISPYGPGPGPAAAQYMRPQRARSGMQAGLRSPTIGIMHGRPGNQDRSAFTGGGANAVASTTSSNAGTAGAFQ